MSRWKQLFGMTVTTLVLGMVPFGHAQDATDAPQQQPPAAPAAAEPAQQSIAPAPDPELAAEVQQLRADVDQMKDQLARLNSMLEQMQSQRTTPEKAPAPTKAKGKPSATAKKSATASPAATIPPVAAADETTPLTVLVFHDGHRTEARNYAIVGQTLWIYTQDDSKKVPLSELDVAATKNANSDRGIIFQVPNTK
jgi:hypothetical protein